MGKNILREVKMKLQRLTLIFIAFCIFSAELNATNASSSKSSEVQASSTGNDALKVGLTIAAIILVFALAGTGFAYRDKISQKISDLLGKRNFKISPKEVEQLLERTRKKTPEEIIDLIRDIQKKVGDNSENVYECYIKIRNNSLKDFLTKVELTELSLPKGITKDTTISDLIKLQGFEEKDLFKLMKETEIFGPTFLKTETLSMDDWNAYIKSITKQTEEHVPETGVVSIKELEGRGTRKSENALGELQNKINDIKNAHQLQGVDSSTHLKNKILNLKSLSENPVFSGYSELLDNEIKNLHGQYIGLGNSPLPDIPKPLLIGFTPLPKSA